MACALGMGSDGQPLCLPDLPHTNYIRGFFFPSRPVPWEGNIRKPLPGFHPLKAGLPFGRVAKVPTSAVHSFRKGVRCWICCKHMAVVKKRYPKWNPGKWNQRLKPTVQFLVAGGLILTHTQTSCFHYLQNTIFRAK